MKNKLFYMNNTINNNVKCMMVMKLSLNKFIKISF